jgi:hypothetical protein
MSQYSGIKDNHKKNTKPIAATIVMAGGIVIAAILLLGLTLIVGYQQFVLAQEQQQHQHQQNMTGIGAATGGGGGMTGGAMNTTNMGGGATQGENEAMTGGAQGNDSMSEVRMQLKEAQTALQNKDIQGALMHLDLAVNAFGGTSGAEMNMTGTTAITSDGGNEGDGGILEGSG